jgi:hypothetical protein
MVSPNAPTWPWLRVYLWCRTRGECGQAGTRLVWDRAGVDNGGRKSGRWTAAENEVLFDTLDKHGHSFQHILHANALEMLRSAVFANKRFFMFFSFSLIATSNELFDGYFYSTSSNKFCIY